MGSIQHTLKQTVSCTGIGLHSGKKVSLALHPAEPDTGLVFKRVDLPGAPLIPADVHHVVDTSFSTTIGADGVTVSTVEHLLAALAALQVDNVLVEVDAPEVPVMDGSAAPFVFLIRSAGMAAQNKPRQYYRVKRRVNLRQNGKEISLEPADKASIDFTIEFDHRVIGRQSLHFSLDPTTFQEEISRARTFGFLHEVQFLREKGLALGGSLENAVVLDRYAVLNDEGLRYADEFVRHKVLDLLGDMALVGRPIVGAVKAFKSGHNLNSRLFGRFLRDPQAWQLVTPALVPQVGEASIVSPAAMPSPVAA